MSTTLTPEREAQAQELAAKMKEQAGGGNRKVSEA